MRLLRFVLRMLGWLLTPLVAWAASFSGAVVGAVLARALDSAIAGVAVTLLMGLAFALAGTHGWLRLVRRNPELRAALQLDAAGAPLELGSPDGPRPEPGGPGEPS